MGLSTKVVLTVPCSEGWRGGGWPARVRGWKRGAGRKEVCREDRSPRTDALAVDPSAWMSALGSEQEPTLIKHVVWARTCVCITPLNPYATREGGTIISVPKMRAKA